MLLARPKLLAAGARAASAPRLMEVTVPIRSRVNASALARPREGLSTNIRARRMMGGLILKEPVFSDDPGIRIFGLTRLFWGKVRIVDMRGQ